MGRKPKKRVLPDNFKVGCLAEFDGRTKFVKQMQRRFGELCEELGGYDSLTPSQRDLLEKYVWLLTMSRKIEAALVDCDDDREEEKLTARWVYITNALRGVCRHLGLAQPIEAKGPAGLSEYLRKK